MPKRVQKELLNDAEEEAAGEALKKSLIRLPVAKYARVTPEDTSVYGRFAAKERGTRIRYIRRQHQPYRSDEDLYNGHDIVFLIVRANQPRMLIITYFGTSLYIKVIPRRTK